MSPAPAGEPQAGGALPPLLAELEQVLVDESEALRRLDRAAIDRAAEAKERLTQAILGSATKLEAGQLEALERLKKRALRNQMLLAHARDSVRQVLGIVSGRPSSPVLGGLRVDVRG